MKKHIEDYTKEELELLSYKDITYLIIKEQGPTNTPDLFKKIISLLELSNKDYEAKIGDYYTSLATDKRFIMLEDGCWDLRDHHKSSNIVNIDDEEEEEEIEETDEEEEDEDNYDDNDEEEYDDTDEDLKDLVVIDEDEME